MDLENLLTAVAPPAAGDGPKDLKRLLESYERALITTALAASGGNQRRAARSLGILPTTLNEKMKRLGLRGRVADGSPSSHAEQSGDGL
jgi:DNA-binding NtrC family response regulator